MKKFFVAIALVSALSACNNSSETINGRLIHHEVCTKSAQKMYDNFLKLEVEEPRYSFFYLNLIKKGELKTTELADVSKCNSDKIYSLYESQLRGEFDGDLYLLERAGISRGILEALVEEGYASLKE